MPQILDEILEIASLTNATADRRAIVMSLFPLIMKERVQQRTVEQIIDVPVPQVMKEIVHSPGGHLEVYHRTDRRVGEVTAPSSDRGCAFSTDYEGDCRGSRNCSPEEFSFLGRDESADLCAVTAQVSCSLFV